MWHLLLHINFTFILKRSKRGAVLTFLNSPLALFTPAVLSIISKFDFRNHKKKTPPKSIYVRFCKMLTRFLRSHHTYYVYIYIYIHRYPWKLKRYTPTNWTTISFYIIYVYTYIIYVLPFLSVYANFPTRDNDTV